MLANNIQLGLDAKFKFQCRGCGCCCQNCGGFTVIPADLFRIAKVRSLSMEVVSSYGDFTLNQSQLPEFHLRPAPPYHVCPFLQLGAEGASCEIYPYRPTACALYPLELRDDPFTEAPQYSLQCDPAGDCGRRLTQTVYDWLGDYGSPKALEAFQLYSRVMRGLTAYVLLHKKDMQKKRFPRQFHRAVMKALYWNYSPAGEYLPQLRENIEKLNVTLGEL